MLVISRRTRAHKRIELGARRAGILTVEQILRDVLLLAQDRAAGGFGRMCREHRLDAHRSNQFAALRRASIRRAAVGTMQSAMPPGCGVLESLKYWRRRRTRWAFSAVFTAMNQSENARVKSVAAAGDLPCARRCSNAAPSASPSRPPDRRQSILFDELASIHRRPGRETFRRSIRRARARPRAALRP